MEAHVFGRASHDQERRYDYQNQRDNTEHEPSLAPTQPDDQRRSQYRHDHFGKTDAHARQRESPAPLTREPMGNGDIDYNIAHERIADRDETQPHQAKLREIIDIAENDITQARDDRSENHQPAAAITVHQCADNRR